jgi:hypothetical protein
MASKPVPRESIDKRGTMIKEVKSAALAEATAESKPNPWTRRMFMVRSSYDFEEHADNSKLYGCLLIATFNSCINGYDSSLMSGINAYPQYRLYFGFPKDEGTPSTGIVYAIYTIGNLVGSFAGGPAADRYGEQSCEF